MIFGRKFVSGQPGSGTVTTATQLMSNEFKDLTVEGSTTCSSAAMGGDPAGGYFKHCFCGTQSPGEPTDERATCTLPTESPTSEPSVEPTAPPTGTPTTRAPTTKAPTREPTQAPVGEYSGPSDDCTVASPCECAGAFDLPASLTSNIIRVVVLGIDGKTDKHIVILTRVCIIHTQCGQVK